MEISADPIRELCRGEVENERDGGDLSIAGARKVGTSCEVLAASRISRRSELRTLGHVIAVL